MEAFLYQPLPQYGDIQNIRLIEPLPRDREEPLRCLLRNAPLRPASVMDLPRYKTISYSGEIQVAEDSSGTTTDSSRYLGICTPLHLRHQSHSRTLWADTICVNQEDLDERNSKVNLMGHVYQIEKRI
ncbi:hypothetical protein K432DRAFT_383175 [Lepidopterella palustris CBS 459.81]|uniref:Heterokaryon incompatibility domain-containing protein n=1 Tax=Lepidopterella palustris CBS 459.81 TaxID=1314670 RepID=A0A8E2E8T4_9PEZI|nr:hypothetical protein K432DRAFT_383175 [Lepidopterella palustris CBS 459.81]